MNKLDEKLINELKNEHVMILERLEEIYKSGAGTVEARQELRSIRDMLFAHLQKEEDRVYSVIRASVPKDHHIRDVTQRLDDDKEGLLADILDFFGNHDTEDVSSFHFARDFGSLRIALSSRFRQEEHNLFPTFLLLEDQS